VLRNGARAANRVLDDAAAASSENAARRAASRSIEGRDVRPVAKSLRSALKDGDEERALFLSGAVASFQPSSHKSPEEAPSASSSSSKDAGSLKARVREAAALPRLGPGEVRRRSVDGEVVDGEVADGACSFDDSSESVNDGEGSEWDCEADVERSGGRGISSPVR
jgi:hypothetical protein